MILLPRRIRDWLYDPRVRGLDVDGALLLETHARILREKPLLRAAFASFYEQMLALADTYLIRDGLEVELGSGAGFFKELRPELITSDIRDGAQTDRVIDALAMDLPDNSVRCIYAINVFHHLKDPSRFFSELLRVLKSGGGCILIEPHNGPMSSAVHRRLHTDEYFDPDATAWASERVTGPLSGANQALAYIVFERDLGKFEAAFGDRLKIVYRGYATNGLRYLISGGVNFRQLLPSIAEPLIRQIESLISPFAKYWSLHQATVLRKM